MSDMPEQIGGSETQSECSGYMLTGLEELPPAQRHELLHLIGGYGLTVEKVTAINGDVTTGPVEIEPKPEVRLLSRRDLQAYVEGRFEPAQAARVWNVLLETAMDRFADQRPTIHAAQRTYWGGEKYPPVKVYDETGREITSYDEIWQMRRASKPTTRVDIQSVYARLLASERSTEAWNNSRSRVPTLNVLISWVNDSLLPEKKLELWEE